MISKQEITMPAAELKWEALVPGSPVTMSVLWDDVKKGPFGMLLKLPGASESGMHTHASDYHGVLVQGTWVHTFQGDGSAPKELTPGSYVMQPAQQFHNDKSKRPEDMNRLHPPARQSRLHSVRERRGCPRGKELMTASAGRSCSSLKRHSQAEYCTTQPVENR